MSIVYQSLWIDHHHIIILPMIKNYESVI